jgi:hypothetical protein
MESVVPLRARSPWSLLPAIVIALLFGGAVAACCLAIVFGIGAQPAPAWTPWLLAIAGAAFGPVLWLARRWRVLRAPARLVVGSDTITIAYPEILRSPLGVSRRLMRVALVDDDGSRRFRVHADSGPYSSGDDDRFLWVRGHSTLAVLAPTGVQPNLALVFEEPVAGADVRRPRLGSLYPGERVAALLVAARDAGEAERALAPLGVTRPLTMPDALLLEDHMAEPDGGRIALALRHYVRISWGLVAAGAIPFEFVAPHLCALGGGVMGIVLYRSGRRGHGAALAIAGLALFGGRLVLTLG